MKHKVIITVDTEIENSLSVEGIYDVPAGPMSEEMMRHYIRLDLTTTVEALICLIRSLEAQGGAQSGVALKEVVKRLEEGVFKANYKTNVIKDEGINSGDSKVV